MEMLQSIPIFVWVLVPAALVFVLTFSIVKHVTTAAYAAAGAGGGTFLIVVLFTWLDYLDNHFVGTYDVTGLPSNFSHSGWRLIFDSWLLWGPPALFFTLTVAAGVWFFKPQKRIRTSGTPGSSTVSVSAAPGLGSQELIKSKLENEKLRHRLAITEEKYRIAKERGGGLSSKDTRTTLDIKQLREQLVDCKRLNTGLKKEIDTLSKDLERTNHLVDQLLEEKYGS